MTDEGTPQAGAKVLALIIFGVPFVIWWAKTGSRIRPGSKWDPVFVVAWLGVLIAAIVAWGLWAVV